MKNNKVKIIIIIIILILLLVLAGILLLVLKKDKAKNNIPTEEIPVDYYNAYEKQLSQGGATNNTVASLENDATRYYCVKGIIDNFITYVNYFTSNIDDLDLIVPQGKEQEALKEYRLKGMTAINYMLADNYKTKYSVTNEYIYNNLKAYAGMTYNINNIYCVKESDYINTYYVYGQFEKTSNEYSFIVILDRYNNTFELYLDNYLKDFNYTYSDVSSMKALNVKTINANEYNTFSFKAVSKENIALDYYNQFMDKLKNNVQEAYNLLDNRYKNARFKDFNSFNQYVSDNINTLKNLDVVRYSINDYGNYSEYICIDDLGNNYIFKQTSLNKYTVLLDSYSTTVKTFEDEYNELTDNTAKAQKCLNMFFEMINRDDYQSAYDCLNIEFRKKFNGVEGFKSYVKNNWPEFSYFNYDETTLSGDNYTFSGFIRDIQDIGSYNATKSKKTFILKQGKTMKDFELSFNI